MLCLIPSLCSFSCNLVTRPVCKTLLQLCFCFRNGHVILVLIKQIGFEYHRLLNSIIHVQNTNENWTKFGSCCRLELLIQTIRMTDRFIKLQLLPPIRQHSASLEKESFIYDNTVFLNVMLTHRPFYYIYNWVSLMDCKSG